MAQLSVNHVAYAFVVKDFPRQATTITNPASSTYIKEGEVVVSGLNNKLLTSTASTYDGIDAVKIVQGRGDTLFSSPEIKADNVTFYKVTGFVDKQEKIIHIGWNGTSGSLENNVFVPGTTYEVVVKKLGLTDHYEDAYYAHKSFGMYNESLTAGEAEIARKLVKNGVDNFSNEIDGFVKVEMVTQASSTAITDTVDFVEGSKVAVASSAGHGLAACDYIVTQNDAVYYIESVDGANIYLETPYQGTNCTITPKKVTDPTSGHWGIRLTGKDKKFDETNLKFRYDVADFDVSLRGFSNTPVAVTQKANLGNGRWEEVCQLEWEVQDYEGQTSHTDFLMPSRKRYFEKGKEYDILIIRAYDDREEQITGTPKSPFTVFVAIPIGCDQGDAAGTATVASGVATALDNFLTANTSKTYSEAGNLT